MELPGDLRVLDSNVEEGEFGDDKLLKLPRNRDDDVLPADVAMLSVALNKLVEELVPFNVSNAVVEANRELATVDKSPSELSPALPLDLPIVIVRLA